MATNAHTVTPRGIALQILERCQAAGSYANLALDAALKRYPLSSADKGLVTALVYGTIEKQVALDWILSQLTDRSLNQLDSNVLTILRMGLLQLTFMDRIPEHAAVNESVNLATRRSAGYVNAILRNYLRKKDSLQYPDINGNPMEHMSVQTAIPVQLCQKLTDAYGFEKAFQILKAFEDHSTMTIRVNTLLTSREELISRLMDRGISATPTPLSTTGIILSEIPVRDIPGYDEGLFFVQDEASQLCVEAVHAEPGMSVLDTCACPGSKSFGLAMCMQNRGQIMSCDLHSNKLSLIQNGASRLGIQIIDTLAHDGQTDMEIATDLYDRILCDVPCSGYGILGKKPEIRHKSLEDASGLPPIQLSILSHAARLLKPGGRIVYSTCTLLPEENIQNVNSFLNTHADYQLISCQAGALDIPNGYVTLTPDEHHTDGFFIAVIEKKR